MWYLRLAAALAALATTATTATRETVSFDLNWKHRTGLTNWAAWDDHPPRPRDVDPGVDAPEAQPDYDDGDWLDVQLPHDGLIVNPPSAKACPGGCSGHSYIPRHVLWYRKTFAIPDSWLTSASSSTIWLEFQGSFRNTTVWWNGKVVQQHDDGYTPFRIELTQDLLETNNDNKHTIAVFVDPDNGFGGGQFKGSGWWYEGGGLYRHVTLVKTSAVAHVVPYGLFVKSDDKTKVMEMEAAVSVNSAEEKKKICYRFSVQNPDGSTAVVLPKRPLTKTTLKDAWRSKDDFSLWSTASPHLYTVTLVLLHCDNNDDDDDNDELDRVSTTHGVRTLGFDANKGFFLNSQPYKMRGFCDHDTFAVLGMALPDRINLFRAQAARSIGGNARRTSHNPPDPALLDIYDRLGMVVIDETRSFFYDKQKQEAMFVEDMGALVQRDRNHPSVVVWSFCNEGSCEGSQESGPAFQNITDHYDGTRPTLANMFSFGGILSKTINVQGFSHRARVQLDKCHQGMPDKPILMSECCSCNTVRGQDEGCETIHDNPQTLCPQKSFNAHCLQQLVNASDGAEYAAGTMVWTLLDYYGEPSKPRGVGQHVSSTYGQYDLCGFPKAAAFWFRTQWLLGIKDESPDKPFATRGATEVQIVESWESPDAWDYTKGNKTRSIHVYSNAPFVELYDPRNKSLGVVPVVPMVQGNQGSFAEWNDVKWSPGTLTAVARSSDQKVLAKTTRATNAKAAGLQLSLDCPSVATGTGTALFADGQDVGLVRATVVDERGNTMHLAAHNVTFKIVSGPGRIVGTANGDPSSYQPHVSPSQSAYHGLVRAIVRVTSTAGWSTREKQLLREMHSGTGGASILDDNEKEPEDIVVEASTPGFKSARLTIPVSADPSASVMAVASSFAGKPVDFFKESSLGDPVIITGSLATE